MNMPTSQKVCDRLPVIDLFILFMKNIVICRSVLLGKVLRIDVSKHDDSSEQKAAYSIPSDNPYVNDSSKRAEIYSYGIRNIWRCDIDEGDAITGTISMRGNYGGFKGPRPVKMHSGTTFTKHFNLRQSSS